MRVLVTGHDGYLGSVMVPVLREAGHEVDGFDLGLFHDCTHGLAPAPLPGRFDLREVEASGLAGFDAVVHLAALSNDPLGNLEPETTFAINLDASLRLAQAAKEAGVSRFLFSSSCSIYGTAGDAFVDERAPMRPVTPYAESKVRVEEALHDLADDTFSPVMLRNATAYGWSPRLRLDLVVNDLVASALLTGEVRVLSDGTPWRPLVHAADIAAAFLAVLEAPTEVVHDEAFNIGSDEQNYRVSQIAEMVADAVPGARVVITGETGPDPRSYRVDFTKLSTRLPAFRAGWDVRKGAADLAVRFGELGLDEGDRERFTRLRWIARLQREGRLSGDLRWLDRG